MRTRFMLCVLLAVALLTLMAEAAAPKVHVIAFGKWTTIRWLPDAGSNDPVVLRVRPLLIDGRVKEHTVGPPHDITDRLFVVRRVFRVNDSLPQDAGEPRWQWQPGGWLLVDRLTGRILPINLPEFDAYYSQVSWYRDYAAYCGVSDDGKKVHAIVVQIARRKPVLKDALSNSGVPEGAAPDSVCPAPSWQRNPARVGFEPARGARQTFVIHGHIVDLVNESEDEDETTK